MELVGLSYSSWFVYRYLLFKARAPRERPTANHAAGHCICLPCPASRREAGRTSSWSGGDHMHGGVAAANSVVSAAGACFRQATRAGGDLSSVAAL